MSYWYMHLKFEKYYFFFQTHQGLSSVSIVSISIATENVLIPNV